MTTPATAQPVDPYRRHIGALGIVATIAVPDGDNPDLVEALELLDMLGITADGELRPDDTSSILVPGMGGNAPGADAPPSARRQTWGQADDPRGLSTSPAGLRDYDATEPRPARVRPIKVAAPKAPPVKRAPRPKKVAPPRPAKAFDQSPVPPLDIKPRAAAPAPAAQPTSPKRRTGPRYKPIVHGTPNGYSSHYRRKEKPCDACKDAWNDMTRTKRANRKKHESIVAARRGAAEIATELDAWFGEAQRSTLPTVNHAAAVAISALMALRIAVDDLARAERAAVRLTDDRASA